MAQMEIGFFFTACSGLQMLRALFASAPEESGGIERAEYCSCHFYRHHCTEPTGFPVQCMFYRKVFCLRNTLLLGRFVLLFGLYDRFAQRADGDVRLLASDDQRWTQPDCRLTAAEH